MELIRGIGGIKEQHQGCVVTIGNFDGVHLGHQHLLVQVKKRALEFKRPVLAILFEPQPSEYFLKDQAKPRIMCFGSKFLALADLGIDKLLCLHFDAKFAATTAKSFIEEVLIAKLAIKHIVIGDDFVFGGDREGNLSLLQQYSSFTSEQINTFKVNHTRVSSQMIRKALDQADLVLAARLMNRPYSMFGRVAHGDKRGRLMGYPTANVFLPSQKLALTGVFAAKVHGLGNGALPCIANLGRRPTFGGLRNQLEVYILDFDKDIYGQRIVVEFVEKIRDERKLASMDALKLQLQQDEIKARSILL